MDVNSQCTATCHLQEALTRRGLAAPQCRTHFLLLFPPFLKFHPFHSSHLLSPLPLHHRGFRNIFSPLLLKMLPPGFQPLTLTLAFFPLPCEDLLPHFNLRSWQQKKPVLWIWASVEPESQPSLELTHLGDFYTWASVSPSLKWRVWSSWL